MTTTTKTTTNGATPSQPVPVYEPVGIDKVHLAQYRRRVWHAWLPDFLTAEQAANPDVLTALLSPALGADRDSQAGAQRDDLVELSGVHLWGLAVVCESKLGYVRCEVLTMVQRGPQSEGAAKDIPPGHTIRIATPSDNLDLNANVYIVVREGKDGRPAVILNQDQNHRTWDEARRALLAHPTIRGDERGKLY